MNSEGSDIVYMCIQIAWLRIQIACCALKLPGCAVVFVAKIAYGVVGLLLKFKFVFLLKCNIEQPNPVNATTEFSETRLAWFISYVPFKIIVPLLIDMFSTNP